PPCPSTSATIADGEAARPSAPRRMTMQRSMIMVAAATLAAFGCGGSSTPADHAAGSASGSSSGTASGTAGQTSQQSAQQMASGLQQLAQGMQQIQTGPDGKPIQVVD